MVSKGASVEMTSDVDVLSAARVSYSTRLLPALKVGVSALEIR